MGKWQIIDFKQDILSKAQKIKEDQLTKEITYYRKKFKKPLIAADHVSF